MAKTSRTPYKFPMAVSSYQRSATYTYTLRNSCIKGLDFIYPSWNG